MISLRRPASIMAGGLAALAGLGWLGLQVPPKPYPPYKPGPDLGTVSLPDHLPDLVCKHFQVSIGDALPKVETAVLWGRARLNFGVWMPARFQVFHVAGYHFVRHIEVTWFGLPVLKVRDEYVNGCGATVLPWASITGPEIDQGANLVVWSEGIALPSLLATEPRIHWDVLDDVTARLTVPLREKTDDLTVRFDPQTGLIRQMWAQRYRTPGSPKEPWRVDFEDWRQFPLGRFPATVVVTWENDGKPWSYWNVEGAAWNVDVSEHIPGGSHGETRPA